MLANRLEELVGLLQDFEIGEVVALFKPLHRSSPSNASSSVTDLTGADNRSTPNLIICATL
jgi:hypothetical protein